LFAKTEPQTGLEKLWELNLLSQLVKAVALQKKFRPLFSAAKINEVHRGLDEPGYFK
jgi:hypothetical protein